MEGDVVWCYLNPVLRSEKDSDALVVAEQGEAPPLALRTLIIPHYKTFSTTIQPPYSSTKG
jgi:hypothetical protein